MTFTTSQDIISCAVTSALSWIFACDVVSSRAESVVLQQQQLPAMTEVVWVNKINLWVLSRRQ